MALERVDPTLRQGLDRAVDSRPGLLWLLPKSEGLNQDVADLLDVVGDLCFFVASSSAQQASTRQASGSFCF